MTEASSLQLRDYVPCIHLFRAVGIAFDVRKLLLGAIAWIVLVVGQAGIARLPFADEASQKSIRWPHILLEQQTLDQTSNRLVDFELAPDSRIQFTDANFSSTSRLTTGWSLLTFPIQTIVEPAKELLENGLTWSKVGFAWTHLIWAFVVWALFGVALARMSVIQFATLDRIGIVTAMRFSLRQLQSACTAPFLPLLAFGVLFAVISLLGLASSWLPTPGSFLFGVLWIVVLVVGFLMTMLLIGIALTWPLMIATIGTEDSDGFDALSRSFGYLLDRPWYLLILVFVAGLAGMIGWAVLNVIFELTEYLATWSLTSGFGGESAKQLLDGTTGFAPHAASAWQTLFIDLLLGFVPAYFFAASTLIYLLVRQSDDGTAMNVFADYDQVSKQPVADGTTNVVAPTDASVSNDTTTDQVESPPTV